MIRCTLVGEGSTDRALCPILNWLLMQHATRRFRDVVFATFPTGKPRSLADRIASALDDDPCELLFVHRDSDQRPPEERYEEIQLAVPSGQPFVAVVPITMQEAWFFLDEAVMRRAANRPNGKTILDIPKLSSVEQIARPKERLYALLRDASETTGRDRKKFSEQDAVVRMSQLTEDWSPLRQLSAFRRLEMDVRKAVLAIETSHP